MLFDSGHTPPGPSYKVVMFLGDSRKNATKKERINLTQSVLFCNSIIIV